ncbi:MAG: hypothetical protein WC850_06625 [Candidatus Gracilibacteria bacterium]
MKKILKLLITLILISYFNCTLAATVDHFDVKLSATETSVNKAVDLTIEAKDKSGNIVKDYKGTVLILSETDPKAELPKDIKDNSYVFKTLDQGVVKFENSLIFKSVGKQEISVFDFYDENILGIGEINVIGESTTPETIDISIISPENGIVIGTNYVTVSGKTQKNHKVKIKIDGEDVKTTTSNNDGVFEEKLDNLKNGDSTIKAVVLDADNKEIGVSKDIKITIKAENPEFNSIKITPSIELEPETSISIQVKATKGLKEVVAIINDEIIKLIESTDGVYDGKTTAPKAEGEYNVDVKLTNELGNQTNKRPATKIKVVLPDFNSGTDEVIVDILAEEPAEVVSETGTTAPAPIIKRKKIYKITNLQLTKLKTKSILSWDSIPEAISYNIYKQLEGNKLVLIDNIKEPRYEVNIVGDKITYDYFLVEPVVKDETGDTIKGELSDITEIQTGPKELLLLLFLSLVIGFFITKFRRKVS